VKISQRILKPGSLPCDIGPAQQERHRGGRDAADRSLGIHATRLAAAVALLMGVVTSRASSVGGEAAVVKPPVWGTHRYRRAYAPLRSPSPDHGHCKTADGP